MFVRQTHDTCGEIHRLTIVGDLLFRKFKHQFIYNNEQLIAVAYSQETGLRKREFANGQIDQLDKEYQYVKSDMNIHRLMIAINENEIVVIPIHEDMSDEFIKKCQTIMIKELVSGRIPNLMELYQ